MSDETSAQKAENWQNGEEGDATAHAADATWQGGEWQAAGEWKAADWQAGEEGDVAAHSADEASWQAAAADAEWNAAAAETDQS
jgi:hypothetical protein